MLAPAAILCVWLGGWPFGLLMMVAAVLLAQEWGKFCRAATAALRRLLVAGGVFYIGLPVASLLWLRADPDAGRGNVLLVVGVVWGSDVLAYLVGRVIGGPKLAPRISPGKTWSGAAGGLVGAVLVGEAAVALTGGSVLRAAAVAVLLGVAAQAGDLFESWIKRRVGVKDSGALIPGHGGLLDRVDALLAAAPVAALLASAYGQGVGIWR